MALQMRGLRRRPRSLGARHSGRLLIGAATIATAGLSSLVPLRLAGTANFVLGPSGDGTGRLGSATQSERLSQPPRTQLHFSDNTAADTATAAATATKIETKAEATERSLSWQAWGVLGVCAYLSFGVFKVVPIVTEGIGAITETWQWGLLAATLGFQLGFSPRVVSRAWVVSEELEEAPAWHKFLAPAFCIGYFHGTNKRVITSWVVTTVIFAVVIGVKQLDNPYRAIVDAGVVVGLVWGIVSILVLFAQSLSSGKPPEFDPALPEDTPYTVRPPPGSVSTEAQTASH
eukprot:TRINITY_DN19853_c0_g1_i2.p1 TRINITY_DN19853_c0_g1~~TRINITY_DN19853_c0_g1_i2.p1  ORF type:complete len:289 (-),score=52.53 TRINITY_DN19853_c0_g1_i2:160-1026(-)